VTLWARGSCFRTKMPTVLPLKIRKAPTIYEVTTPSSNGFAGNGVFKRSRDGTFYDPSVNARRRFNCGATGFEFVKPSSVAPTYRYYSSMNQRNWNDTFLYGTPTYADSSHPRYSFWQSVSPNLYSFLNTYHSGGLPTNKLIKVWVSWDKYVSVSPRAFEYLPEVDSEKPWRYEKRRQFSHLTSSAGVCCRYAIFS